MKNIFVNDDQRMKKKTTVKIPCLPKNIKVLFILKKRNNYGNVSSTPYGLRTSCFLVSECLKEHHIESKIVEVIDGNGIDKEIHDFKPDFAIIEAVWCPPYKIEELVNIYPKVKFSIRLHSKFPFLAQEKMAIEWLVAYNKLTKKYDNLTISANNEDFVYQINNTLDYHIKLLPNCYPIGLVIQDKRCIGDILDIGCFGALRILKNQIQQAVCAIYLANKLGKKLRFHINDSSTFEKEGNPILNNLVNLFKDTHHQLLIHNWVDRESFLELVRKMDAGMQVSFSESYNIVAADFVSNGVPIIGSDEIEFLSSFYQANPTDFQDIVEKLKFALYNKWWGFQRVNSIKLKRDSDESIKIWLNFLNCHD